VSSKQASSEPPTSTLLGRVFRRFESAVDPFPEAPPEKPPAGFWPFVWHFTRPFRWLILACAGTAAVVAALEVSLFAFLGSLVDWLAEADRDTIWSDHGLTLAAMALCVLLLIPLLKLLYEAIVHQGLMGNFAMRNRWQAHRYVLRQSMRFFEDDFAGRVATKIMQSALAVRDVVLKVSEVLLYVGFYFLSAVALIASSDLRLAAPLLLWLGGYLLTMRYFVPRLSKVARAQADARSVVTGRIVDSYTNIATVKMFAHAAREDDYARDGMVGFLGTVHDQMRLVTVLTLTLNLLNGLMIFSVAGLAIWLWTQAAITTGAIAFSIGLCLRMQGMAHWILWEVAGLFENIGVVRDGIETIARERQVVDAADAVPLRVEAGRVQFEDVTFDYGRSRVDGGPPALHRLSLDIAAGERIGLVGRSGAGKSTLVNLLLRLYDVDGGRILVDGQDISAVQQGSLRASIGMVTQDTSLLHRTVLENILYGDPDAGQEAAVAAARRAHAHEFILGLEDQNGQRGYDALVGERGVKLSGGQRQRVAIARVLLKNAPIIVLDEATSALDSEVEEAIQEQLYNLMQGKTVIAIAHRLSTIAAMDRLVVIDAGRIVEMGSHQELLRAGGLYSELWARQSGGFIATTTDAAGGTEAA
jgi:ATP-binding cassette subfamily B multidrug efflux pump